LKLIIHFQFMSTAYLLIGGNLGNRTAYLQQAIQLIGESCGNIVHSSAIYETAAWGVTDQPSFYNQALALETTLAPEELMQAIITDRRANGRTANDQNGPQDH
jgi:2-amino-4-hydroxy-6-hydroxymethyldihydropteridine diphosphokinase